jgi:hypothetical protein
MKKPPQLVSVIKVVLIFCMGIIVFSFFFPNHQPEVNSTNCSDNENVTDKMIPEDIVATNFSQQGGTIFINITVPKTPTTIPIYRAIVRDGDILVKRLGNTMSPKHNVTSETDAPDVAKNVMEPYGGLPSDAVFVWSETNYLETQNDTGGVLYKEPVTTSVAYGRKVNGLSLDGDTDYIRIELGENGEPLEIRKLWRTISFAGNVSIIPASKVVNKIELRQSIDNEELPDHVNVFIDTAVLRYYEKGQGNTYLDPVWIFIGRAEPGDFRVKYVINARKFANFTITPQIASNSTSITFTDTSDTSVMKWYWEFGDGTNSTLQNPTHVYLSEGNYTINLTTWNEYGSDNISRENCLKILPIHLLD